MAIVATVITTTVTVIVAGGKSHATARKKSAAHTGFAVVKCAAAGKNAEAASVANTVDAHAAKKTNVSTVASATASGTSAVSNTTENSRKNQTKRPKRVFLFRGIYIQEIPTS